MCNYESKIHQEQYESALKSIFEAIETDGSVKHYINAGIVLHKVGRDEEAERFLQKAIVLEPEQVSAYYTLGNIYYNHEKFNEAIHLYLRAYPYDSNNADVNFMIAMSYVQLGQLEKSLSFFEAAYHHSNDTTIIFQYGLLCCQLELFEPAEKLLSRVLELEDNADAEYNLGLLKYVKYEDQSAARQHFIRATELQKDHHLAHHALKNLDD